MGSIGKILVIVGTLFIVVGIILWVGGQKMNWIGRLPGDIRIEKENFRFYFPITTMLLFSLFVSILIRLFQKFF